MSSEKPAQSNLPSSSGVFTLLKAVIYGSVLSFILFVILFIAVNQPECPSEYTQAQVDAAGCTVGANIGMGLVFLFGPFLYGAPHKAPRL